MGATHKETVTEIVKSMINAGYIKSGLTTSEKEKNREVLKQAIYLVEYGVHIYKDPETKELIEKFFNSQKVKTPGNAVKGFKVVKDINNVKK